MPITSRLRSAERRSRALNASSVPAVLPGSRSPAAPRAPIDWFRLCVMLALIFSVGRLQEHIPILLKLRPGMLTTVGAVALALLTPNRAALRNITSTTTGRLILALSVFACIAAPFGLSLGASGMYLFNAYSRVLMLGIFIAMAIRNSRDLEAMFNAYLFCAAFLCYLSVFVVDLTEMGGHAARLDGEAFGGNYDANDLSVLLIVALPLAILAFQTSGRLGKLVSTSIVIGIGCSIALGGSRGGFVGLVVIGLTLLIQMKSVSIARRLAILASVAIALTFAAPPGYWQQMQTIVKPKSDYNWTEADGRMEIWKRGVGYMARYPFFGVGMGNFGRAEGTISEKARRHQDGERLSFVAPHNSFIQVGAELGVPGLILWSSIIGYGVFGITRLRRRLPREWETGDHGDRFLYLSTVYLPIAFLAFAITGFFVSFAFNSPIFALAAFAAGLQVAVRRRLRELGLDIASAARSRTRRPLWRQRGGLAQHGI